MIPPEQVPEGVYRATRAVVDLDAVAHNLHCVRSLLPAGVEVCAVVKADAYGHGAVPVARRLAEEGVERFAVATVEEGVELRLAGIRRPILLLGAGLSGIQAAIEHDLTPVVFSPSTARRVARAAREARRPIPIHLKFDTGMGRLGLLPEGWEPVLEELLRSPGVRLEGIATHFSSAESDPSFTRAQVEAFQKILDAIRRRHPVDGATIHMANSAGILNHPEAAGSMVRPGLMLYGAAPDRALEGKADLRPAMSFRTRVLYLKQVPAGSPLSYGQTFRTKRPSRIATLPVGYADGVRRALSNRGSVLVRGRRAPVVGNVTMDLTLVDVTDVPGAAEGDEVVLFGRSEETTLPVEEVAEAVGTIPYEILCGVGRRVPRVYLRHGASTVTP